MDTKLVQHRDETASRTKQGFGSLLLCAFFFVVSLFIMINVHEIGHTVFARLFGDNHAFYALYRLRADGSLACVGCNVYDEAKLSFLGNVFVTLGGVTFSQLMAITLLWYGEKAKTNQTARRFFRVVATVCLFDVFFQVAQGIVANIAHQVAFTRVDIADFIWLVANRVQASPVVVKGIVLAILSGYSWWIVVKWYKGLGAKSTSQA